MFSNVFFSENRAVYEIMWKNIVETGRPLMAWGLRIACGLPKATNTHSEYVTFIAFSTATAVIRTRLDVTLHVLCRSCNL